MLQFYYTTTKEVVTKIEKYKKEMEKLNKKALKLLDRSLGDFIPEEAFKIKSREIKEKIDTIKSKLYFIEENKDKVLTEDEIIKILNSFKEKNDKEIDTEIVETFVKDIKIFKDKIELILFKVPKSAIVATPMRIERTTYPLGGGCSIQLSYGVILFKLYYIFFNLSLIKLI